MAKVKGRRPRYAMSNKAKFEVVSADYDNNRTRLCLDLARTTGFAVWEDGEVVDSGKYKTFPKTVSALARIGTAEMFLGFKEIHQKELFKFYGEEVDEVCIEFADFQQGQNARYFTLNYTAVCLLCHEYGIPMTMVYTFDIKRHLSINNSSDKALVVQAVNNRYGTKFTKKDHDIADAIAIAYTAHEQGERKVLHFAP